MEGRRCLENENETRKRVELDWLRTRLDSDDHPGFEPEDSVSFLFSKYSSKIKLAASYAQNVLTHASLSNALSKRRIKSD